MQIIILCSYYNRPILFRKCLESVRVTVSTYSNWEMVIGDDNSPHPAEDIVKEVLPDHLDRVKVLNSHTTREEKGRGVGKIGQLANQAIRESNADIGIFLCDDDLLMPGYFNELSDFYTNNSLMYGYCNIAIYNPFKRGSVSYSDKYNRDIADPVNNVDASQVSFRLDCFRNHGVKFPENSSLVENLDAAVLRQMKDLFGKPGHLNFCGQTKGIHDYQMMWNKKKNIIEHLDNIDQLAGKIF